VKYVADTHVLVRRVVDETKLSAAQRRALKRVGPSNPLLVSDVSLLEIAFLVESGRLRLTMPVGAWLAQLASSPSLELARVTPAIAAEVAALPKSFRRDPADRAIVATARAHGATLLTSEAAIVAARLVPTID
jgi:PIN domain nuclease of toxin-antitoxin system